MKLLKGFSILNPAKKMFFISTFISSMYTVYLLFNFTVHCLYGIMVSSVTLILSYIYLSNYSSYPNKWKIGDILLLILTFITVFHLPSHFIATSRLAYQKELNDHILIKLDKFFLGWLIKDGQVSLYIDQNNFMGPHTILGQYLNNSLQIFYFFYYLIPYITMHFMSLANCGKEIIFRFNNKGKKSLTYDKHWTNTLFIFGSYLLACVFVFFTNTLVPASSPRIYLKDKFIHPLNLSGFGKYLNKKCKDDKSANSFPSGHVAEVLTIGIAYILENNYFFGIFIVFCSFLIAMATLFLRYHYFCDILAAIVCSLLAIFFNYCFGYKKYLKNLEKNKLNIRINNSNFSLKIVEKIENANENENSNEKDEKDKKDHIEFVEEVAN